MKIHGDLICQYKKYNSIKGFTFIQSTVPTDANYLDIWYDTIKNKIYLYVNSQWELYDLANVSPGVNYGYCFGGYENSLYISSIDRIQFPFDSGTATQVGNLAQSINKTSACNSSNYGYVFGGYTTNYHSFISRIAFPFDSGNANNVGVLSSPKNSPSSCNSFNYGYCCGGLFGASLSTVERITFPFDSGTASQVGTLSSYSENGSSCNSSNYGYVFGGLDNNVNIVRTYINRFIFPFNSGAADIVGNLANSSNKGTACNSSNYGYSLIGITATSTPYTSYINRIQFPFDSGTATNVGNLSQSKAGISSCNGFNYGYCFGGYTGTVFVSSIDRITFPFDSGTATQVGNLTGSIINTSACDGTDFVTLFA